MVAAHSKSSKAGIYDDKNDSEAGTLLGYTKFNVLLVQGSVLSKKKKKNQKTEALKSRQIIKSLY